MVGRRRLGTFGAAGRTHAGVLFVDAYWSNESYAYALAIREILVEGDRRLFNQYGVIVVNPARHPHAKKDLAQAFADWVVAPAGQAAVASYRIGGEQLFFPNANQ